MTEAIILAGGFGTRLRSRVSDRPKPMAEVAGRPFLEHLIFYCSGQGVEHFIISIGHKGNFIRDYFGGSFMNRPITYVHEEEPLGTGGALIKSYKSLKSNKPFVLLNGDTYFEVDIKNMILFHKKNKSKLTIALFVATESDRFGLVKVDSKSVITNFNNTKASKNELANGGVYVITPSLLKKIKNPGATPISLEATVVQTLLNQDKDMFGYKQKARFIDIGLPRDYENAQFLTWRLIE